MLGCRDKLGSTEVTVALTPTGYADAISPDGCHFVMPHEKKMTIKELISVLQDKDPDNAVPPHYVQKQNSNLTDEFGKLFDDISELDWASEAFGKKPDAINFWMGDQRCVTSSELFNLKSQDRTIVSDCIRVRFS